MMSVRKSADNALGAYLRRQLGWRPDLPKSERDAIAKHAKEITAFGEKIVSGQAKPEEKRKSFDLDSVDRFREMSAIVIPSIMARKPYSDVEDSMTDKMEEIAVTLPVWQQFGSTIRGFGARSLAVIIAEAGDLSNYSNPGKLWKRMGLAPIQKGEIAKAGSTWRAGGLTAEDWTNAGYSMRRRSCMFVIGDTLLKLNDGIYRQVYDDRKEYERIKASERGLIVAPSAKIPKKSAHLYMSDGHIHRRAKRYMEKRFLRDLWQAWRRAMLTEETGPTLPVASISPQGEAGLGGLDSLTPSAGQENPVKTGKRRANASAASNRGLPDASSPGQTEERVSAVATLSGKREANHVVSAKAPMPRAHSSSNGEKSPRRRSIAPKTPKRSVIGANPSIAAKAAKRSTKTAPKSDQRVSAASSSRTR
jgi:hypothetical protein